MLLRAKVSWNTAEAAEYGDEYIPISAGDIFLVERGDLSGWTLGTKLQNHARGWFPTAYVEESDPTEISPSFIVDIHFHLTCAISDKQCLMLQLVLPPEYYTPKGKPLVLWECLLMRRCSDAVL